MNIRGAAKTEIGNNEDGNNNPLAQTLNRESNLSRELFAGRLTEQDLNSSGSARVEKDLKEVPHIYSDAVLYKVVHTIDT